MPIRSQNADQPTMVTFKNVSPSTIRLFWHGYDGKLKEYAVLNPGGKYAVSTFVTHPWSAVDVNRGIRVPINNRNEFYPRPQHETVYIGKMFSYNQTTQQNGQQITLHPPLYEAPQPAFPYTNAYNQPGQPNVNAYIQPGQPIQSAFSQQPIQYNPTGYAQQPPQYGQPVTVQAVQIPVLDPNSPSRNEFPVRTKCPHCQQEITTQTEHVVGSCTWMWCIILAFMGCILCCFLPFLWDGTQDVVHSCPNCKVVIGKFVRQQQSGQIHGRGGYHRRRRRR